MNLSDYINLTLEEIAIGAQKATETYQAMGKGCVLSETRMVIDGVPYVRLKGLNGKDTYKPIIKVTFHVAVELDETTESNSKFEGSLKVVSVKNLSQEKEGKKRVQEITFDIPVLLPSVQK